MVSVENRPNFAERVPSLWSFNSNSLRSVKFFLPIFKKSFTLHKIIQSAEYNYLSNIEH